MAPVASLEIKLSGLLYASPFEHPREIRRVALDSPNRIASLICTGRFLLASLVVS